MKKELEVTDKKMVINNSSGITLIALAITVIVMMIIATISIYEGTKVIKEAKVQTLETNMLAIKAKAKACVEEVEAATWAISNETEKNEKRIDFLTGNIDENKYQMEAVTIDDEVKEQLISELKETGVNIEMYSVTTNTLDRFGLNEIKEDIADGEKYIIVYNKDNFNQMDIVYTAGIEYKNNVYYTLSGLQAAHDNE